MTRRFVDLSVPLETGIASDPPQMPAEITYFSLKESADQIIGFFP